MTAFRNDWVVVLVLLFSGGCGAEVNVPEPDTTHSSPAIAASLRRARKSVLERPSVATNWAHFGQLCMVHQFSHEAISCLERASELSSKEGRWPYLISILQEEFALDRAVKHCAVAVQRSPTYAPAHYRFGVLLARSGKTAEATAALRQAEKLAPKHAAPLLALARLAIGQRDWMAAEELLKQAGELAPTSRVVFFERSRNAARLGDQSRSEEYRRQAEFAIAGEPALDDVWLTEVMSNEHTGMTASQRSDQLLMSGQLAAAEQVLRQLVQEHPELARAWLNLAMAQAQQGKAPEALVTFSELIQRFPADPTGYVGRGRFLLLLEDFSGAQAALTKAVSLKPDSAEAHLLLGRIAEHNGQDELAEQHFRQAILSAPEQKENYSALAALLGRLNRTSEEREILDRSGQLAR